MTDEERKAHMKAYYKAHKAEAKAYREAHKAEAKAYREAHRDKINAKSKKYYEAHKTKVNAYQRQHYCCEDIFQIENYSLAKADNFIKWDIHHRLETNNSDGERRLVDLTADELKALGMYYNRPASELIFITHGDHTSLHNKKKKH